VIWKRNTHSHAAGAFRAVALASILLLPGCTSVSTRKPVAVEPAPAVRVMNVSSPRVKEAPLPVSDDEVSGARDALRDALTWGAQYYQPQMYG